MPALNFKKQFAPMVIIGLEKPLHPEAKRQTIRAKRKDGRDPKAGQTLYLFTGLRTTSTVRLGEAECKSSEPITIDENSGIIVNFKFPSWEECTSLAKKDGFDGVHDFVIFFKKTHGLPFNGFLIKW